MTELARVGYDQVFQERGPGVFQHEFGGMVRRTDASLAKSDIIAAKRGVVSITPIRLAETAMLSAEDRALYERPNNSSES